MPGPVCQPLQKSCAASFRPSLQLLSHNGRKVHWTRFDPIVLPSDEITTVLILATEDARPGMKLAAPVQNPDQPDQVLLKSGYVLEPDVISKLREMHISMVFIDYPELADLDRHIAPYLSPARLKIYSQIKQSIATAQKGKEAKINFRDYKSTTRNLIETLMMQGRHPIFLDQMARLGGDAVGH